MARGRRVSCTAYLECRIDGYIIFLRQKIRTYKKDGYYEHEVITKETFQKAKQKGWPIQIITKEEQFPKEALNELKKLRINKINVS